MLRHEEVIVCLSKTNENDIERVQKSALKLILKENYKDYKTALKTLNIESLYDRREKLCLKFARKCLKDDNFKKLFPYRKSKHSMDMRKAEKFHIKQINTERYRKSAIPAMLRLLNEEDLKMKQAISNLNVTREPCLLNSISVKI